jgi:FixJ family two-component response regulator
MSQQSEWSEQSEAATPQLVAVIDDDVSVRESLPFLLESFGFAARAYPSAREFLDSGHVDATKCLLLDVVMPEMSGPELQRELVRQGRAIPVIFITANVNESVRQRLLEHGAIECLFKPFSEQQLHAALDIAFASR